MAVVDSAVSLFPDRRIAVRGIAGALSTCPCRFRTNSQQQLIGKQCDARVWLSKGRTGASSCLRRSQSNPVDTLTRSK